MTAYDRTPAYFDGNGSPLVLLHGLFASWPVWTPVLPALTEHHTVFAPTLAGHRGGPGLPAGPLGIAPLADAVERQMDDLGWERAHLVGNSLGGWLAAELAERGRATSLVLFSPAGAWNTRHDFKSLAFKMRLLRRISHWKSVRRLVEGPGGRRALFGSAMIHGERISHEEADAMLADIRFCLILEGLLAWVEEHPHLEPFTFADVPARVAWAQPDKTIPWKRYGQAFTRLVPGAEAIDLTGVGHVPMSDDPALVARTILEFTASNPQPSGSTASL